MTRRSGGPQPLARLAQVGDVVGSGGARQGPPDRRTWARPPSGAPAARSAAAIPPAAPRSSAFPRALRPWHGRSPGRDRSLAVRRPPEGWSRHRAANGRSRCPSPPPRRRPRPRTARQRNATVSPSTVNFTAFSTRASRAASSRASSPSAFAGSAATTQSPVGRRTPALGGPLDEGGDVDRSPVELGRLVRVREHQQPTRETAELVELVDDDVEVVAPTSSRQLLAHQLGVAAGNGDRRAHLVRAVADEELLHVLRAPLPFDQLLGLGQRSGTPPDVPHHGDEHHRHQRHLGQLLPVVVALDDESAHAAAGRHDDHRQDHAGTSRRPALHAVHDGKAHPDEVERDHLEVRDPQHDEQAGCREGHPAAEEQGLRVSPPRRSTRHCAPSR